MLRNGEVLLLFDMARCVSAPSFLPAHGLLADCMAAALSQRLLVALKDFKLD